MRPPNPGKCDETFIEPDASRRATLCAKPPLSHDSSKGDPGMRIPLISLAMIGLVACSAGAPTELTASLQAGPPGPGHEIGGSIDVFNYDQAAGKLTVEGWHMLTPETRDQVLNVYVNNAVSIESVTRRERPDVAAAIGNSDLKEAGFALVLNTEPGTPVTQLCISMTDEHYGARLLNAHTSDQPPCFGTS